MPTTLSFDRYSAVSSSSSSSSTSSNSCYNNKKKNNQNNNTVSQSSRSSATFLPLHSAISSFHLSKLNSTNYRSMQSLKINQTVKLNNTPVARISPFILNHQLSSKDISKTIDKDESWLSCDELENIEKRFTDLLQEPIHKVNTVSNKSQHHEHRAKSCDRLIIDKNNIDIVVNDGDDDENGDDENETDDNDMKSKSSNISRKSLIDRMNENDTTSCSSVLPGSLIYDNNTRTRSRTPHQLNRTVLSSNDILKVESTYRSIGTHVFACHCLCDLFITTTDRLAKLEDWILFQHGLPVWLLNSGVNPKRQPRLSLVIAEQGSGFPIWQDTINDYSDIKQSRPQHITFRLSDRTTLAVIRFYDLSASKEFYSYYLSVRRDSRYQHLFSSNNSSKQHRSSSCGSLLRKRRKSQKNINKSSISNPCQFQHITSLQVNDRVHLVSLDQCLVPSTNYSNQYV